MSGLSSIGSSLATSGTTAGSSSSLLSQVGQSLLTSGAAPDPVDATAKTAAPTSKISTYQAEYLTLQQQDTAELLYASFLSPSAGLANADAVLGQAAQLLGTPGSLPAASTASSSSSTSSSASSSSSSSSVPTIPSVSSVLAASDAAAQQSISAYANAPAGSSIIDYQA
jgi:hypothetical protein